MFKVSIQSNVEAIVSRQVPDVPAAWREFTQLSVRGQAVRLSEELVGKTPYASIAGAFAVQDVMPFDSSVESDIINRSGIWKFREFNMVGEGRIGWHPPYGPGTRLAVWAAQRGVSAKYVANQIAVRGIEGNRIIRDTLDQRREEIRAVLLEDQRMFIRWALGMGTMETM